MTRRPDDCSLTPVQLAKIRNEAERALREAGALGVLPTPIQDILAVANVEEVKEDVLNEGFLARMRHKAGDAVKRALSKVMGLFDAAAGLIFLDQLLMPVKKRFVTLHEAGHGFLPWQRAMYKLVEDCDQALDPQAADLFDREANVFASEVLFQNDAFHHMAADEKFSIWTPIKLAKKFDASLYSSIRQYVSKHDKCCVVLVLNPPELIEGDGFRCTLRRVIASNSFLATFGEHPWPAVYTPDDELGRFIPVAGRKSSGKRQTALVDRNGDRHDCVAESFTQTHQVFILVHAVKTLGPPPFLLRAA
ncbi:ImmA/IrrE family metallo-endopeptidase [Sphingomonas radiodurans]|uniref:ImmA/IrrE family metallo-endopeptidase n=1 Tax=Sphingomonas radiodurans TaxID=2890321 RepID=UPI001E5C2984|nr:ImmA/IrrE family metallo-endopeptidase [Sphingomonas radiodurans]WBH17728.1 ImmA/IrrE family metallo-endopeptidase [Sphingomonas radiodurans]